MGVHLIGGGWAEDESGWTGRLVAEAAARVGRPPTLVVVLWAPTLDEGAAWHQDYRDDFARLGVAECRIVQLTESRSLTAADLDGADAVFVGGGLTPGYHASVMPAAAAIRDLVASGVPYGGFSAGAMIAGRVALLGGWRIEGVPVIPQDWSEGLDEVSLAEGLGLVEFVVDVHVSHAGTLGRAVGMVHAGLADRVIGVDECTSVIVDEDVVEVAGQGRAWLVSRAADGRTMVDPRSGGMAKLPPVPRQEGGRVLSHGPGGVLLADGGDLLHSGGSVVDGGREAP